MVRNTWESILDLVQALLGVGHGLFDVVHGIVEDVRNAGDHVGNWVGGETSDSTEEISEDDLADLLKSIRSDSKKDG